MSDVVKSKRKDNPIKVKVKDVSFDIRIELEDYIIQDFAISEKLKRWDKYIVSKARDKVFNDLEQIGTHIEIANSIHMKTSTDYEERRKHTQLAIGYCNSLVNELEYIITKYEHKINVNKYKTTIKLVKKEINHLKGWRASIDSVALEKGFYLYSATNFANVNNNGNANNNNASNTNIGARP